mmetsp:Transcript_3626/g.9309  ORF Transcript_3626/g.9309 Transcript_3626/m.9309 type:complete len:329 (-) Transcript_3626:8-994(-)
MCRSSAAATELMPGLLRDIGARRGRRNGRIGRKSTQRDRLAVFFQLVEGVTNFALTSRGRRHSRGLHHVRRSRTGSAEDGQRGLAISRLMLLGPGRHRLSRCRGRRRWRRCDGGARSRRARASKEQSLPFHQRPASPALERFVELELEGAQLLQLSLVDGRELGERPLADGAVAGVFLRDAHGRAMQNICEEGAEGRPVGAIRQRALVEIFDDSVGKGHLRGRPLPRPQRDRVEGRFVVGSLDASTRVGCAICHRPSSTAQASSWAPSARSANELTSRRPATSDLASGVPPTQTPPGPMAHILLPAEPRASTPTCHGDVTAIDVFGRR